MASRMLALAAVLIPLLGCSCDDRAMRNGEMQAAVNTVRLAVEEYANDHGGSYPTTEGWMAAVAQKDYLTGHQLPKNPWTRQPQRARVAMPKGLPTAKMRVLGARKVAEWAPLGKGREPDRQRGAVDALDFGALIYDCEPRSNNYVIYGIGKQGDQAIVAGYGDSFEH